jgi:hypothetical protein
VTERINQAMHFQFSGKPDPLVFHVPQVAIFILLLVDYELKSSYNIEFVVLYSSVSIVRVIKLRR